MALVNITDAVQDYMDQHRALGLPSFDIYEFRRDLAVGYDATCGIRYDVAWALTAWEALWGNEPEPAVNRTAELNARELKPRQIVQRIQDKRAAILPQSLQSTTEIERDPVTLEAQRDVDPVAEMHEALDYVVTHWEDLDARRLPGHGFMVYRAPGKPSDAHLPESQMGPYIIWRHERLANRVVIGMRDLKTDEMCYVARKEEVRAYMAKAGEAVKSKTPPPFSSTGQAVPTVQTLPIT